MNIEEIRSFCLSLPLATEEFPFDETTLTFKVLGKIFLITDLLTPNTIVVKCDPEYAFHIREEHSEIEPGYHMNKKYWNQIDLCGRLADSFVKEQICLSYREVVKKLTKREKTENPAILAI